MKVLFLAGGLGTRLKEMTQNLPKALIPILEKPLISFNIEKLKKYNIDEVIVSTGYLSQQIQRFLGDGKKMKMKISYQNEQVPLGTAGAIKAAGTNFSEDFFVFNADVVSDIDLEKMLQLHKKKKAAVTIAVTYVEHPEKYGVIEEDEDGYINAFKEKPNPGESDSHLINAGVYIFDPKVLNEIPNNVYSSVERNIYPLLLQKKYKMAIYNECTYWRDLGTPEDYLAFHQDILYGKVKILSHDFLKTNIYIGAGTKFGGTVKIIGPAYIGDGTVIKPDSVIGPNTVLGKNTIIGRNTRIKDCVIWANTTVKNCEKINDAVVLPQGIVGALVSR